MAASVEDPTDGEQVAALARASHPTARVELHTGTASYLLHVWIGDRCSVIEHRTDHGWGVTPNLAADEPGFDSGHPFVFTDGPAAVEQFATALDDAAGAAGQPEVE